jgi:hypothetical protein
MKKLLFVILSGLILVACSKKSEDTTSEFSNSLKFGTGLNPSNLFLLTGEGTVFPKLTSIYFRLESQDDMAGSAVKIQVNKSDGSIYNSYTFPSIQSYGHIYLTSFSIPDAGNYTATGILVTGNKTIATQSLTIQ